MDSQALWIVALSIATPVAGVVGFAIQIREAKKARLENEKLQLEIAELKKRAEEAEKRIVLASGADVQKFAPRHGILFSRSFPASESISESAQTPTPRTSLKRLALMGAIISGIVLFVGYLLFDLYRVVEWIASKL